LLKALFFAQCGQTLLTNLCDTTLEKYVESTAENLYNKKLKEGYTKIKNENKRSF